MAASLIHDPLPHVSIELTQTSDSNRNLCRSIRSSVVWKLGSFLVASLVVTMLVLFIDQPAIFVYITMGFSGVVFSYFTFEVVKLWRATVARNLPAVQVYHAQRRRALNVDELIALVDSSELALESRTGRLQAGPARPGNASLSGPGAQSSSNAIVVHGGREIAAASASDMLQLPFYDFSVTLPPSCSMQDELESSGTSSEQQPASHPTCTICLEDYRAGERISIMPCLHTFHLPCLTKWLGINASCPVCKADLHKFLLRSLAFAPPASEV